VSNSKEVAPKGRVATVYMEEEYMRLQIDYPASDDRTTVCSAIDKIEKELEIYPEVVHKRNDSGGSYFIEFSKDLYTSSRLPGEFIDKILQALSIDHCQEL